MTRSFRRHRALACAVLALISTSTPAFAAGSSGSSGELPNAGKDNASKLAGFGATNGDSAVAERRSAAGGGGDGAVAEGGGVEAVGLGVKGAAEVFDTFREADAVSGRHLAADSSVGVGDSCASHSSCSECAASSWGCHWCAHDNACHSKGSIHGCAWGASCDERPDDGKKNGTDPDSGGGGDKKNGTDDSCAAHATCKECASSSWECHWCAHDNACHAIGSRFGCIRGDTCDEKPDDGKKNGTDPDSGGGGDKKNGTNDSCAAHATCKECASSSWDCHWCAHDNACHAIGSRFGCIRGDTCDPPPPPPPPKNETGCSSHATCKECASSSWNCHWCAHDRACHAVGSIHGCLRGESCDPPTPPPPKKNDTSCAVHRSCSECARSSWECHWCAHDNACHAKGSIHGCISGVNCYSNDRCTRKGPEPIERNVFAQIGMLPALVIVATGMAVLCCATACVSVVGCAAGAYDDLTAMAMAAEGRGQEEGGFEPPGTVDGIGGDASEDVALMPPSSEGGGDEECDGDGEDYVDAEEEGQQAEDEEGDGAQPCENADSIGDGEGDNDEEAEARTPLLPSRSADGLRRDRARAPSDVARFYTGCKICYAVTVATVVIAAGASLVCFPKAPDYNVCNDQVAWRSIVDGMTSGKMQASFQLLMSVENPNHMSVEVDMGSGTFKHDGVEVGTFEIPTTTVGAMSITDVLVAITFTPDKWEALALSTEYAKGTLKFAVDATATVVIPSLAGYTFSGGIENYIVHTNDPKLQDRHLCACPQWKDDKKKDGPGLMFTELIGLPTN